MMRKLACLAMIGCLLLVASPMTVGATRTEDSHDCIKVGKKGYKCVKGPLAGRSFPSQAAMIKEMRKGSSLGYGADRSATSVKVKKSTVAAKKKSRRK